MDAVLNWLWQGGVVVLVWRLMLVALERASASVRYVVCWAAACLVLALPALSLVQSTAALSDTFGPTQGSVIISLPDTWWTSMLVVLAAWTLWAGIHIVRLVSAIVAIRRARAGSRAFQPPVESVLPHWRRVRCTGRRATLVLSDSVSSAAVLGWGAPMIAVAPSLMTSLDADELDRVLIHEWAHVQRRDDLANILQIVVRIAGGWHPALWWIDRRLHIEREIACDEITVAVTGSPKSYARCLMKLASVRDTAPAIPMAPALFTRSSLRARLIKIVSPVRPITRASSRTLAAATVVLLCLISVRLGALKCVEAGVQEGAYTFPSASPRVFIAPQLPTPAMPAAMPSREIVPDRPPRARSAPMASTQPPNASVQLPAQSPKDLQPSRPSAQTSGHAAPPTTDRVGAAVSPPADGSRIDSRPMQQVAPVPALPPQRFQTQTDPAQSPWSAAAAGGVAIGRKSKDAGVATAGFFTRFARRVSGSF